MHPTINIKLSLRQLKRAIFYNSLSLAGQILDIAHKIAKMLGSLDGWQVLSIFSQKVLTPLIPALSTGSAIKQDMF